MSLKLTKIVQYSKERESFVSRDIVCFLGMPFYRSSGKNSGYANTWFPFYGINRMGIFIKRFADDGSLPKVFHESFTPVSCYDRQANSLPARFGSIIGLLVSSVLGGGLWETSNGEKLKDHLEASHSSFYSSVPEIELLESRHDFSHENLFLINEWLKRIAGVKDVTHLPKCFPKDVEDLTFMIKNNLRYHEMPPNILTVLHPSNVINTGHDALKNQMQQQKCTIL